MYRVVASDLDGTLLLPDHTLSPFSKETLGLLTHQGVHFIFATGRHHVDVGQIRDNLGIQAFMITSNGARVHNPQGELIISHDLPQEIVADLARLVFDHPDIFTHFYRHDDWYVNKDCPDEAEFYQESVFHYRLFTKEAVPLDGVSKLFFTSDDHELLLKVKQQIHSRWGDRVNASFSLSNCLEIMAEGVSKGYALTEVVKMLSCTLDQCVAFGDGMNDLEMLSVAGKGCVMSNAYPGLKELLPQAEVIGSNADEAVAHYLRGLFL